MMFLKSASVLLLSSWLFITAILSSDGCHDWLQLSRTCSILSDKVTDSFQLVKKSYPVLFLEICVIIWYRNYNNGMVFNVCFIYFASFILYTFSLIVSINSSKMFWIHVTFFLSKFFQVVKGKKSHWIISLMIPITFPWFKECHFSSYLLKEKPLSI